MIRTALDSDHLDAFTVRTDFILTYTDLVTDPAGFEAAHPWAQVVYIDRGLGDPGNKATIIDVETGARTPADVPGWLDAKAAAHLPYLTVYVNRANMAAVDAAAGTRRPWRWVATLDGTLTLPGFAPLQAPALVQIRDLTAAGLHADFSLVFEDGWHPAAAAGEPPAVRTALRAISDQVTASVAGINAALTSLHQFT